MKTLAHSEESINDRSFPGLSKFKPELKGWCTDLPPLDHFRTKRPYNVLPIQGMYLNLLLRMSANQMETLNSEIKKKIRKGEKCNKG